MSNIVLAQMKKVANAFDMADVDLDQLKQTLVSTVFKGADDIQLVSLLIVANQYKLNPFTKEIYAFPSRGGIVPIVSIDGWSRIINDNPVCDGIQFEQDDESCTCKIYRKDREHPTIVTEYLSECKGTSEPWKKFPKRMLRHKALIQCARIAFGFSGIFDEDEANRIDSCQSGELKTVSPQDNRPGLNDKQIEIAVKKIKAGQGNIEALQEHYNLTDEQINYVRAQTEVIEHE